MFYMLFSKLIFFPFPHSSLFRNWYSASTILFLFNIYLVSLTPQQSPMRPGTLTRPTQHLLAVPQKGWQGEGCNYSPHFHSLSIAMLCNQQSGGTSEHHAVGGPTRQDPSAEHSWVPQDTSFSQQRGWLPNVLLSLIDGSPFELAWRWLITITYPGTSITPLSSFSLPPPPPHPQLFSSFRIFSFIVLYEWMLPAMHYEFSTLLV